jgi:hypothetical protein
MEIITKEETTKATQEETEEMTIDEVVEMDLASELLEQKTEEEMTIEEVVEMLPSSEDSTEDNVPTVEADVFLGNVTLPEETILLATSIMSHTLNLVSELGAIKLFDNLDNFKAYVESKISDILYVLLPTGAVREIIVEHEEETGKINVQATLNTTVELELYNDRIQVMTYIKTR